MKDTIFNTPQKTEAAISNFTTLIASPGWKLFIEIVSANIEVVKDRLLRGSEEETKEEIDRLRDKLRVYEEMRDTPQAMIDKLTSGETEVPNADPYDTAEQVKKRRGEIDKDIDK